MEDDIEDDHMVQLNKEDFITDEQYAAQHAQALWEKRNPMSDEEDEDHLIQLNKEDFITDEQYAAQHAYAMYQKANPMDDDLEDDHMVQTDTKIQFIDDAQWQFISHDYLMTQEEVEPVDETKIQFIDDAQWQFISHDFLMTEETKGWVELPNCAAPGADVTSPLQVGDQQKDGLSHTNSAATCKPGTQWANTPEAAGPPPPGEAKASGLGTTRPF